MNHVPTDISATPSSLSEATPAPFDAAQWVADCEAAARYPQIAGTSPAGHYELDLLLGHTVQPGALKIEDLVATIDARDGHRHERVSAVARHLEYRSMSFDAGAFVARNEATGSDFQVIDKDRGYEVTVRGGCYPVRMSEQDQIDYYRFQSDLRRFLVIRSFNEWANLPFVRLSQHKDQIIKNYWNVSDTENFDADIARGKHYAALAIEHVRRENRDELLLCIFGDMYKTPATRVRYGFETAVLSIVTKTMAQSGAFHLFLHDNLASTGSPIERHCWAANPKPKPHAKKTARRKKAKVQPKRRRSVPLKKAA